MRRLGSSVIATTLLLGSVDVLAKSIQEITTTTSQPNPLENPSACERVRITLRNGRKIEAGSYKHQGEHIAITKKKGAIQTILDSDIKLVEVRQGSCPGIVVTLKTGERIEGYRRDHVVTLKPGQSIEIYLRDLVVTLKPGQSIEFYLRDLTSRDGFDLRTLYDRFDARTEIRQKDKVLAIADSDIKTERLKFKKTFSEKLKSAALIPVIPFSYLILLIFCSTGGCNDL
jgi:hypothetical protein